MIHAHWRISVATTLTRIQQLGCHLERNISCVAMSRGSASERWRSTVAIRASLAAEKLPHGHMNLRSARTSQLLKSRRSPLGVALAVAIVAALAAGPAFAAAAFVKNIGTDFSESTGTSLAVTVPAGGVAANNTIIVTLAMDPAADSTDLAHPAGVTDSLGNTYTKDADVTIGSG